MSPINSPSLNGWVEGSSQSSPDPLTLSSRTFPKLTTPIRARSKTPVSQRHSRSIKRQLTFEDTDDYPASPSKSFTMDTPGNVSPWRIKVTVEAQPRDDEGNDLVAQNVTRSPRKNVAGEVTKTTIPLKDADDSPPSRGRRKPRRSSGASTGVKKRKPTPARRKSTRKVESPPLLSDISVGSSPLQKPRSRQRNASRARKRGDTTNEPQNPEVGADVDKISDTEAVATRADSPKTKQMSGFNFSALTPLHQKYTLPPPTNSNQFQQTQPRNKPERSGIVPNGWTAPIFSPLPPRASPAKQQIEQEDSSPSNGEGELDPNPRGELGISSNGLVHGGSTQDRDRDSNEAIVTTPDDEEDAEMWRNMIKHPEQVEDNDDAATEGAPETEVGEDDYGLTEQMTGVVGEMTMMQSEEFSMVSIGSLPSARELYSSFIENGGLPQQRDGNLSATTRSQTRNEQTSLLKQLEREEHIAEAPGSPLLVNDMPQRRGWRTSPKSVVSSAKPKNTVLEPASEEKQRPAVVSQPETPADGSSVFQNMSSIMRSWRRNLAPTEPSLIIGDENQIIPVKAQINIQTASDRSTKSTVQSTKSKAMEASLLQNPSSAMSNRTADATRLPTPSSSERDPSPDILPSPSKDEDSTSQHSLRSKLQRAAEEQLLSESNESHVQSPVREENANQSGMASEHSPNDTLYRERIWQREREEVIRQALAANCSRIITIHSDSEDGSDVENESVENMIPQSSGIDIWQEEASRSADLEDRQNEKEDVRSLTRISPESNPRPSKVVRSWRNISATGTSLEEQSYSSVSFLQNESKASAVELEHPRQEESSTVIRDLFKSITGTTHSSVKPVGRAESAQVNSEDIDEIVDSQGNDKDVIDTVVDVVENSMSHSGLDSAHHRSQYDLKSPDGQGTFFYESSAFPSSPIKLNTTILSDVRQIRREVQEAANVHSSTEGGTTMLSDVRQIRQEVEHAAGSRANFKGRGEDEPTEHASHAMKALNPKKATKPLFDTAKVTTRKRKRAPDHEEQITPLPAIGPHLPAPTPSLLSRMYFSFTTTPQRPTHHLLAQLPLLPKLEPWTRTHYRVLDALYQAYKSHPQAFSPYHPANKELLTLNWRHFEDMEFQNLGYNVTITRPLLVLCALFAQLLRLNSAAEFERVEGLLIDNPGWPLWFAAKEKGTTEMVDFTVIVRLFTIIVGEWMREDEAKGIKVPFSGNMMWKLNGEDEWNAGRTAFWKLQGEVDRLSGK